MTAPDNPLPTTTPGQPGGPNSEVHNTGEVWATMMWEAYNVLADAHGITVARRRMSDYVVAGLLLYPHYWLERRTMSHEARAQADDRIENSLIDWLSDP